MTQFEFEQQLMIAYIRSGASRELPSPDRFRELAAEMEKRRPVPQPVKYQWERGMLKEEQK